jgi:hypothetical protein
MPEIDLRIFFFCKSFHSVSWSAFRTTLKPFICSDQYEKHVAASLHFRNFFLATFPILPTPGALTERVPHVFRSCIQFTSK